MLEKVKGLFLVSDDITPGVVTRENWMSCSHGKALTVEETLLLASGMNLRSIRGRNSNPVFIKRHLRTTQYNEKSLKQQSQPREWIMFLGEQQSRREKLRESSKIQEPKASPIETLTVKTLEMLNEASHKQRSDLQQRKVLPSEESFEMIEQSLMRESSDSKTFTSSMKKSGVGRSSKMCSSQSSQFSKLDEASLLPSEYPLEYQKTDSPLAEHWERIQSDKVIAETKKRFFMSIPKPKIEFRIKWKTTVFSGSTLILPDYYQPRKLIGRGSYARVFEALDTRTNKIVAIKRNRGFMKNIGDTKRILRELKLWMWFHNHDICNLLDVIPILHENIFSFEDIYIVLERMDADLSQAVKFSDFQKPHCQIIIYQILRSLKYIHSANVIHRDLKPQNILINALECNTKITDFGCSRPLGLDEPCQDVLTEYVVTRWYRSPEIYLCSHQYGKPCDLWALGCIFAEMYRKGKPLFPGPASHKRQLQLIFSIVGKPERLDWIENPRALKFMKNLKASEPIALEVLCPGICQDGADLLSRLLEPDPRARISLEDALAHPFVSRFRDQSSELECQPFDVAYEKDPRIMSKRGLRMMLYETVNDWHSRKSVFNTMKY